MAGEWRDCSTRAAKNWARQNKQFYAAWTKLAITKML
jgi:hypothetical protein